MGGCQRLRADPWRFRVRRRIRCRTQVPRDAPLSGSADFDQPHFVVPRRACAGDAPLLLRTTMLPLEGLKVIAVEQAVAAPFCSSRLADAGAHVVKIERPEGDFARRSEERRVGKGCRWRGGADTAE